MPQIDGNAREHAHFVDRCPGDRAEDRFAIDRRPGSRLDRENSPAAARDERAAGDGRLERARTFNGERIERAALIVDGGGSASHEPKATALIEPAEVARAMPYLAVATDLRLRVAHVIQIRADDVRTAGDDLYDLPGRERFRCRERRAPASLDDANARRPSRIACRSLDEIASPWRCAIGSASVLP